MAVVRASQTDVCENQPPLISGLLPQCSWLRRETLDKEKKETQLEREGWVALGTRS